MEALELVRTIYAGLAAKDPSPLLDNCADDVTLDQDPRLPWGGHFVGRDGLIDFMVKLSGAIDTKVTIEQIFQAGDDVVQSGRTSGSVRSNGAPIDVRECHVWTVRDGVVVAARFYIDSEPMLAALGLPAPG